MKLGIVSDLHVNFSPIPEYNNKQEMDALVIAGDISPRFHHYKHLFEKCLPTDIPIIIIAGNHEFEGKDLNTTVSNIREVIAPYSHVTLLDNEKVDVKGVRFIGSTLWTNFSLAGANRQIEMNWAKYNTLDFKAISDNGQFITPEKMVSLHEDAVEFLNLEIEKPFEGEKVVVTHFCPSPRSIHERYAKSFNSYWTTNLEHLMGKNKLWIHGHVHNSSDYMVEETRVVCNPRGYVRYSPENPEFELFKIVEV